MPPRGFPRGGRRDRERAGVAPRLLPGPSQVAPASRARSIMASTSGESTVMVSMHAQTRVTVLQPNPPVGKLMRLVPRTEGLHAAAPRRWQRGPTPLGRPNDVGRSAMGRLRTIGWFMGRCFRSGTRCGPLRRAGIIGAFYAPRMATQAPDRKIHLRTCPLCEAMCGLEVHVEDDEVKLIRGDRDDVWSKGYLCPKGTTLGHLHHDPDRLREPMVRDGDQWREVTWDEAFDRCTEFLRPVIERHGIEAVTAYVGNPLAHNMSLSRYIGILIGMSGIPMIYSAGTVDQWPKNVSSHLMYGGMWKIPVPDIRRTDFMVVMGANPARLTGFVDGVPRRDGRDREDPRARRRGRRHRPASHRHRRARRRVAADHTRAPMPRSFSRSRTSSSTTSSSASTTRTDRRCRRRARPRRRLDARTRRGCHRHPCRTHPRACAPDWPPPTGRSSTAASACATRSSARSPAGWSTS